MKIAVYAIAYNEESNVNQFMNNLKEADMVIVGVDKKTKDNTKKLLKHQGAKIIDIDVNPWRFDTARNIVLDSIPNDFDVCIALDMDDVIMPGWRQEIEKLWKPDLTRIRYSYIYTWLDEAKTKPKKIINGFKIHRRNNVRWVMPIHEYLELPIGEEENEVYTDNIIVNHYQDVKRTRSYLDMIDEAIKTENNPSWLWYLRTRQSFYDKKFDLTIESALKFLDMTKSYGTFAEQRSECCRLMAISLFSKKNNDGQAQLWLMRACSEWPMQKENWAMLADAWLVMGNYHSAYAAALNAMNCNDRRFSAEADVYCWDNSYIQNIIDVAYNAMFNRPEKINREARRKLQKKGK